MSEFFQEVRDFFVERLTNPLWISFVFIWLLWNWELPVTAIFDTNNFSVSYLNQYFDKKTWLCHTFIPLAIAFGYCVLSKAIRDIIILFSRAASSVISWLDRKYNVYGWIKRSEHEAIISRLSRTHLMSAESVSREQKLTEECEKYHNENARLTKRLIELTNNDKDTSLVLNGTTDGAIVNAGADITTRSSLEVSAEIKARSSTEIYKEMITKLNKQEQVALNDPSSNAFTLLVLQTLVSPVPKNKIPDVARLAISANVYSKCLSNLLRNKLAKKEAGSDAPIITSAGKDLMSSLEKDSSANFVLNIFRAADDVAKGQIISLLESKNVTLETIADSVVYTPNLIDILNLLIEEGKIRKIGERYFKAGPVN